MKLENFPWKHGLKEAVQPKIITSVEELVKHPLFDYVVAKSPVYGRFEDMNRQITRNIIDNLYVLYRKDTLDQFATCTKRYKVRQNSELLMFANNILKANVVGINPKIVFASISNRGARLYIVINISFTQGADFDVSHNIILYAGHDTKLGINFLYIPFIILHGSQSLGIRVSSISPITKKEFLISFKHTASIMETFQKVYGFLNNVAQYTKVLDSILTAFSERRVTHTDIVQIIAKTFMPDKDYIEFERSKLSYYSVSETLPKSLVLIMTEINNSARRIDNPSLLFLYIKTSEILKRNSSDDFLDAIRDKNTDYLSRMFIILYKIITHEKEKIALPA